MIPLIDEKLETYANEHTSEEPELLARLERETYDTMKLPQMLTGKLQGTFLKMLVEMTRSRQVIEVGMFTGYSTLMMASALPEDGKIITCEVNPKAEAVARKYIAKSPHGQKIEIRMGPALETLQTLDGPFDFAFIDADKSNYSIYYELCLERLRRGGIIAVDNVLWSGRVLDPEDEDTRAITSLNDKAHRDARVEQVLLPIRDGLLLARKL